jgi:hypothetical protein
MNIAVRKTQQIARPIKVLVPLIQSELSTANEAGLEHYRRAGEMLLEAKGSGQILHGSWGRWLSKNFELSRTTAGNYMRLARLDAVKLLGAGTIEEILGYEPRRKRHAKWKPLHDATDSVDVERLANDKQTRDSEIKLHRELAEKLIDLGYRAMATRLHPDRGGSRDAMQRLNTVRDELKSIAATRRFV